MDEAWRAELAELIAIPSVSADPAHREDVKRAGEWVCELIRRIGGTAELTPFGERELVLGEIPASNGDGNAPTVLVYNHFDVQPPAPLELWESDPFELDIRGEWAYGRGVADDKGQLWLVLKAAQRLVEAGALPVNLRIAFDGEEEIGGHTIADYVTEDERGADACVIFDGGMLRRDVPTIELATRGLVGVDVKVRTGRARPALRDVRRRGAERDPCAHALPRRRARRSGRPPAGALARGNRPADRRGARRLVAATAGCRGDLGGRRPAARREGRRGVLRPHLGRAVGGRERDHRRQAGRPQHDAQRRGLRRVLDPPRAGPGRRDGRRRRRAAAARGRSGRAPSSRSSWQGANPGVVRADAPAVQLALDAFEQALGTRPLLTRVGGSIPLMPALTEKGIDTILSGFALPESNVHSPNERFLVPYFAAGIDTVAALFTALGRLND